ncbi:accessory Sec system S-layer assembly protein [Bacillus sp. FJAT-45350]|uniref:accessory Sec system S-layer assembly protein n=1 Tax=Bacillus sp. FJAT-45350 TaxID=2011014 RepID=UPI000BB9284D|nr:accessory Sec system S-layer assembly protein [Bacillus sp. FJAT-45350]
MLSFFKRKHSDDELKRTGEDSSFSADDIVEDGDGEVNKIVETSLSLHPSWTVQKEEVYVYQFLNNDCPPLKQNQVGISGIEWSYEEDKGLYRISAFIRNSSNKTIAFETKTLVLLNQENKVLARKQLNLSNIGEIPPKTSRPWHFYFEEEDLLVEEIPKEGWKLAFEFKNISKKHMLDLSKEWEEQLHPDDKENLHKLVEQLRPLQPGEVNLFGVDAKQDPQGMIHVVALLRNGSEENIRIDKVPLIFKDATGSVVANGEFHLKDFTVKPNTSKPWRCIFQAPIKKKLDLTTWEIQLPQ